MPLLWRRIAAPALALSLVRCDGTNASTSPGVPPTLDLVLHGCPAEVPSFLGVQNEGGPWTRVTPGSGGITTVRVTNKVGLAITDDFFGSRLTLVMYGSAAELNSVFAAASCASSGTKTLTGTVSALTSSQIAYVRLGSALAFVFGSSSNPSFTLSEVKSGPLDLIALRMVNGVADKIIIRRQLDLANNSSIPLLDFAASEAATAATGSLTLNGLSAQEAGSAFTDLDFRSAGGTEHSFFPTQLGLTGVPASLTQPGDVHILASRVESTSGATSRSVTQYHRDLGNHVADFGAPLSTPLVSTLATFPSLRMRAQLTAQPEYGGFAAALFGQETALFGVFVTSAYMGGTPAQWNLEMPELSGVQGFPQNAKLVNGATTGWSVQASSATLSGLFAANGVDGTVIKMASQASEASSLQATGVPSGGLQALRRVFGLRAPRQ